MAARALPLAKALAARGHKVLVVLPPWDHPDDAGREWLDGGVRVCNVRLPLQFPGAYHVLLALRLLREALRFEPDVIHCFKPKSFAGLTAWALWHLRQAGRHRARLVVDSDDWEGPGGWNELGRYSWLQKRVFAWQEKWGMTHCDSLTVASRALETIAWSLGVPRERVCYLPNGGSTDSLRPSTFETDGLREAYQLDRDPVVLLYTRFFEYSTERVVAIMRGVLAEEPRARWLVAGKGFFGEEQQLLGLVSQLGIASRVTYAGWVPPEQLPAHFALAQVAIYPFDDTLVNRCKCAVKLIDLMVAGVPVVADAVGQNREYIEHGVSGLLVGPGDTKAFVREVVRLLRQPVVAKRLGDAAQERILGQFGWQELANRAESAYGLSSMHDQGRS